MLTMQVPSELTLPFKMCLKKNRTFCSYYTYTSFTLVNSPLENKHKIAALEYKDQWPLMVMCAHMIIFTFLNVDFPLK